MLSANFLKLTNFISVLQNPTNVVPLLSDKEIYTIIIDSIRAYVDNEINLEMLVDVATKLKLFSGISEQKNEDLNEALIVLAGLTDFLEKEKESSDKIGNVLIDVLDKLSYK